MAFHIILKNIHTGSLKRIKVGFSWTSFFFSSFFGIPIFMRGLIIGGIVMVAMNLANLAAMSKPELQGSLPAIWMAWLVMSFVWGFTANSRADTPAGA